MFLRWSVQDLHFICRRPTYSSISENASDISTRCSFTKNWIFFVTYWPVFPISSNCVENVKQSLNVPILYISSAFFPTAWNTFICGLTEQRSVNSRTVSVKRNVLVSQAHYLDPRLRAEVCFHRRWKITLIPQIFRPNIQLIKSRGKGKRSYLPNFCDKRNNDIQATFWFWLTCLRTWHEHCWRRHLTK